MDPAPLAEIKKTLMLMDRSELLDACLRLARFKKDNKELLTYMLFLSKDEHCLLYTSPSPRDATLSRMPSSA